MPGKKTGDHRASPFIIVGYNHKTETYTLRIAHTGKLKTMRRDEYWKVIGKLVNKNQFQT
jgi:hypothetical protein